MNAKCKGSRVKKAFWKRIGGSLLSWLINLQLRFFSMPEYLWFYLGLSFIIIHEMDAVRCHEWRIFPGLSMLNDKLGFVIFMIAHIPLFAWPLIVLQENPDPTGLMKGLDVFFIIHVGLHILFLRHPRNEFKDWISWLFIGGAGLFGAIDLLSMG